MLPVKLPQNINLNVKGNPLDSQKNWKEININGKKVNHRINKIVNIDKKKNPKNTSLGKILWTRRKKKVLN